MAFHKYRDTFLLTFLLIFFIQMDAIAQVGFPYCEDFEGETQSTTVFGGSARLVEGVLRLTDAQNEQSGFVYIDIPFSAAFGIKASFEYFSYGGTGADGLTAFLFDAGIENFAPGGFGGSLGYAQRNGDRGLTGGYLGIGFDSFGNFGRQSEDKVGGFPGDREHPDAIVVRGPGDGLFGYPFVVGRKTNETGEQGLPAGQLFELSSGGPGTQRITDPNVIGYRKVFLDLEPVADGEGFLLTVEMLVTTENGNPRMVGLFDRVPYPYTAPDNLKIGFAASTGGQNNFHEIKNLIVEVSDQDNLMDPIASDIDDRASCEGQENTYEITSEEVMLPNENSSIRCLQLYASMEDIEAEEEDVCSQAKCTPENREMVLPQGTFMASDEGGKFTFFPNFGFTDETIRIYYTVTDNYGKTSSGNYIQLTIQESPDPVTVQAEGQPDDLSEIRRCDGDPLLLSAVGEEDYFSYEWYMDGELIPDSDQQSRLFSTAGVYKIIAYNAKSCPAESSEFTIINPALPALSIDSPVVGCEVGQSLDIRLYIEEYDETLFDYQLESPDGAMLENEEMAEVGLSGNYLLRVKHKDLNCWSSAEPFEVIILTEAISANFDFEVDGTGIKDTEGGGIFIDDPIRFNDMSQGGAIEWLWDFGDGSTSNEQSPVHIFGKRDTYIVLLTATNELGCSNTYQLSLTIDLSYRVMFPTGFTPSAMENQYFRPKTKGIVKLEMLIFSTWGELIYKTDDVNTLGWDGMKGGEILPGGAYVYRLNMESVDGEQIVRSGKFILIR